MVKRLAEALDVIDRRVRRGHSHDIASRSLGANRGSVWDTRGGASDHRLSSLDQRATDMESSD
jgi:hypothetical protein